MGAYITAGALIDAFVEMTASINTFEHMKRGMSPDHPDWRRIHDHIWNLRSHAARLRAAVPNSAVNVVGLPALEAAE